MSDADDPYRNPEALPPRPSSAPPTVPYPATYPPVSGPPEYLPVPYPPPAASGYPAPGYAEPAYTQPAFGQTAYGQPAYAQPAYAQPPYGVTGVDPLTGQPLSNKSKILAGVLQLAPGVVFSLGGIGRLYAGNIALGVIQLIATLVAWTSFWCGFVLILPWALFAGIWLWFVIDGIMILAGRPVDGQGRLLRQ